MSKTALLANGSYFMSNNRLSNLCLATLCLSVLLSPAPALGKKTEPAPNGEAIFKQSCASCHPGGGNVVKPHSPIAGSAQLITIAVFKAYLKSPLGHMPYYKNIVTDKRTLKALYDYCHSLKPGEQAQLPSDQRGQGAIVVR